MANIHDVASAAGVSPTLVSRYLNGKSGVSPQSREKIKQAIESLNYIPNGIARSLVMQRTNAVGIVLDNLCLPFMSRLISGFETAVEAFDPDGLFNIIYCGANGNQHRKQKIIDYFIENRVCGVIIYGSLLSDDSTLSGLVKRNIPLVLVENDMKGVNVNKVLIDNSSGAYSAVDYLIKRGHRRIAHVAGDLNRKITVDRLNGYMEALRDNGIPVNPELIAYSDFTDFYGKSNFENANPSVFYDIGYLRTRELIASGKSFDAVFYASDISAFGGIDAMKEAGLSVPGDISVFGFDDEDPSPYKTSAGRISTMRQPLEKAGYESMKLLFEDVTGKVGRGKVSVLKNEMIIRDTVMQRGS